MVEFNPSGRMQLVGSNPPLAPGYCIVCRSSNSQRGFVDIGVNLEEDGGVIYFCGNCALEIGATFGAVGPEDATKLNDELVEIASDNERLRQGLAEANATIFALRRVITVFRSDDHNDEAPSGNAEGRDSEDGQTSLNGEGESSESLESVTVTGPNDDSGPQRSDLREFGL